MRILSADSPAPNTKSGTSFDSFLIWRQRSWTGSPPKPYIQNDKIGVRRRECSRDHSRRVRNGDHFVGWAQNLVKHAPRIEIAIDHQYPVHVRRRSGASSANQIAELGGPLFDPSVALRFIPYRAGDKGMSCYRHCFVKSGLGKKVSSA
jgi:hypothetical protein